ncbi:hypothetical protein [Nocardia cyriacigeorgica]|uniref:hypothetical protein n=1 Tax=Nocardia cyriacigeorgica TaxID=135487 RepID=UPI00245832F2|nr:hypothetical protein [Nocardia cyriacigeorgica]
MSVDVGDGARAQARAVADAVLYEGYLLYPYRADSQKNQSRWQFGVLGPRDAAASGLGEDAEISAQFLVDATGSATLTLTVRFLQLQRRTVCDGMGEAVERLVVDGRTWISWDEAVEQETTVGPLPVTGGSFDLEIPGGTRRERIPSATGAEAGTLVRTRQPLTGQLELSVRPVGDIARITVTVRNLGDPATDKDDAIARSFIGAHVIADIDGGAFLSLLDPPPAAAEAAADCVQHRCFPVLAGPEGSHGLLLISPIVLYDHPRIAPESEGPLFDSTEIDEILTLRVMTLTEAEKERARATDPRAAQIIDRCAAMSPEELARLHGTLRDPGLDGPRVLPDLDTDTPWWDPVADGSVRPDSDAVLVGGVRVAKDSRVRLRPSRRADAQDLFYTGRTARVASVHEDVDGQVHIAVVVDDDPAAELHEWYGRYLYFAPDEVEPLDGPLL